MKKARKRLAILVLFAFMISVVLPVSPAGAVIPTVTKIENLVKGDWGVTIFGQNLGPPVNVTGAVYDNTLTNKVAEVVYFTYDPGEYCLHAQVTPLGEISPGPYKVKLFETGQPFGGQSDYPVQIVAPVGVDKIFVGTAQKIKVMPNGNSFGTDESLLKAVLIQPGQPGQPDSPLFEAVYDNIYDLSFSGTNLEFGVPDNFNLPEKFIVEVSMKVDAGAQFEFVSRGFSGSGGYGPQYNVGPPTASPGSTSQLDIFGPNFSSSSTVQVLVYSGSSWVLDPNITLPGAGAVSVISDVSPPEVHLRLSMTVSSNAAVGPRKIKVTTGSSVVDIDNRFSIMLPMNASIVGNDIDIDPNGNPVGTDPTKIKLRVNIGPYPAGEITTGFSINSSGHIIAPLSSNSQLQFAKDFGIEVIRISDNTMLGRANYMKPSVGPDQVMPGSFNIPLDIWAPNLTVSSVVYVNVYNSGTSTWNADPNFVLNNSTRQIIEEFGNIGGATKHYQVMMTVKQEAAIGFRQIVVTGPGARTIENALTVMPGMGAPPPGMDPMNIPFMVGGSNVEKMGTVSPEIMFIGIGFSREILITDSNRDAVKSAIQIVKLDTNGQPSGSSINGMVMNPPPPPGENQTVEKNVVLFKPIPAPGDTVALAAYSTYQLTIAQGSITSTAGSPAPTLATTYRTNFTTGSADTSPPQIIRVETRPSPDQGAIVFLFNKPVNNQDAENPDNYNITTTKPKPQGSTTYYKYDPMMNAVKVFPFDLALDDIITGTVSGIYNPPRTVLMQEYAINATVQGFQMGGPGTMMTNTQKAFSPVEVMPTNPSAQSESHYMVRMPIQQQLSAGDKIDVVYPSGFDVTSAVLDQGSPMNQDINGPGTGTVTIRSVSAENISRTVTVILNTNTASNDFLQFELKGIINGPQKNISFDSTTGAPSDGYYCTVTTKSSAGVTKEGPMNSMLFPIAGAAAGGLTGKIVDNSGTGISGVTVYLDGPSGRKEALTSSTSGSEGTFSFTGLMPGGYFLSTEPTPSSGAYVGIMMPIQFFIDTTTKSAGNIVLDSTSGGTSTYYNLAVSVTSGSTLSGKQVDVFAGNPTSFNVQTITLDGNGAGSATLKVKEGTYMVGVGPAMPKGGFMGPMPVMDWMPPMPTSQDIQADKSLNIAINVPNAIISGSVKDGGNNAIPNAEVYAYSPTGDMMGARAVTDSSGSYSLKVKAGEYVIGTHAPGMPWIPEKRVVVAASGTITVNFQYETLERTISGSVIDSDQRPIAKASVVAYRVDSSNIDTAKPLPGFANAVTDTSGNFTLFVKPNSYWILAGFAPNYGELPKQIVSVGDSNVSGKQITVTSSTMGTVQGTVTCGSNPVVNATIWAEGLSVAYGNKAVTNTQGQYTVKLKQGNYRLHLWTPETGEFTLPDDQALITVGSTTVTRNLSLPQKGVITVNFGPQSAGFEAFAHVRSTNGKYQNGGFVKLTGSDTARIAMNVPVGEDYDVKVAVPGIGDSMTVSQFAGLSASLKTGATATVTIDTTAVTLYTLSGTVKVTDDSGAAVSNAWVSINKKDAPFGAFKKTDASGNFSFNVPQGTYFLTADHPSYSSQPPVTKTVNSTTTQNLFVDLISGGITITGTLYKGSVSDSNKTGTNTAVWAIDESGRWVGGEVSADGTYTMTVPNTNATWLVQGAGDGYETIAVNRQRVTISGSPVSGVNIVMTRLKIGGLEYNIKPPKVESITPAVGGVLDATDTGVKITVPANALGSSVDAGQITTKETTGIPSTNLAKPAGNIGKEIKAADSSGNAITKLNDYIDIELDYTDQVNPSDSTKLVDGTPVDNLQLGYWDDTAKNWVFIASTNDTTNHILKGKVDHLTTFAPLVPTGEAPPATPAGLSAAAANSSQINLTWTDVSGATSYNIYRAASAGGDYTKINTSSVTSASYSDTGLSASTTYYYKVSAVNATGESAASGAANATTSAASVESSSSSPAPAPAPAPAAVPDVEKVITTTAADTVKTADGAVELAIPQDAFKPASGEQIKVTIDKVETATVNQILAKTAQPAEIKTISNVFEFEALSVKSGASTKIGSFDKPVNVKLSYSGVDLKNVDQRKLGVYRLDETTGQWIYVGGKVDPANKTVTVALSGFSKYAILAYDKTFGDTISHWAKNDTEIAAARHFVSGVNKDSFAPDKDVTRAEFAVMLAKALSLTSNGLAVTFKDVQAGDWFYSSVAAAVKAGIISGYSADTFAPNDKITREQMASMIARALTYKGLGALMTPEEIGTEIDRFKDGKTVSGWAQSAVAAVAKEGIIKGRNTGDFAPQAKASRAEAAVMLNRLFDKV